MIGLFLWIGHSEAGVWETELDAEWHVFSQPAQGKGHL